MKIVMMKGLPASGKSTIARKLVYSDNFVRINRDDLRKMMFNSKWSGAKEDLVIKTEAQMILMSVKDNRNVVIDDTNLGDKNLARWENLAKSLNVNFEVNNLTTVSVEDCIARDFLRNRDRVG